MVRASQFLNDYVDIETSRITDVEHGSSFKVGDLSETKDVILHTLRAWSIWYGVTFKVLKSNAKSFYCYIYLCFEFMCIS